MVLGERPMSLDANGVLYQGGFSVGSLTEGDVTSSPTPQTQSSKGNRDREPRKILFVISFFAFIVWMWVK